MGLKRKRLREENRELRSMVEQYQREQDPTIVEYLDVNWDKREVTWMGRTVWAHSLSGSNGQTVSTFRIPVATTRLR